MVQSTDPLGGVHVDGDNYPYTINVLEKGDNVLLALWFNFAFVWCFGLSIMLVSVRGRGGLVVSWFVKR